MPFTLYGIKNCDTMKKARAWLDKHKVIMPSTITKRRHRAGHDRVGVTPLLKLI